MLRDYQIDMKARLVEAWKAHRSVMVQMPTGTGKTHLLASVVSDFVSSGGRGSVWLIAHRRELVSQIEETLDKYGIGKETRSVRVMSVQWLSRHWEEAGASPDLIVIDEAHHALAASYAEMWERYPEAKKLGMTATPCRLNRRGFTKLFEVLVTSWSVAEFIEKGLLSVFDYVSIRPDSEDRRLIDGLTKLGADGDYQVKEMDAVLNRRPCIERLYRSVRRFASGRKGIVYAVSIDHARRIAEYYSERGLNAVAIDSRTPTEERKRVVREFRCGDIEVLVNVDVFSEGFDCPDVEFVQLARPTLSLAKYLQQVGRGLRKSEGKEACMLIDNVGLYRIFGLPTQPWNWQAMFEGRMAGKGALPGRMNCNTLSGAVAVSPMVGTPVETVEIVETVESTKSVEPTKSLKSVKSVEPINSDDSAESAYDGGELVMVMEHDRLLSTLRERCTEDEELQPSPSNLKAFMDKETNLWGLKRGEKTLADAVFREKPIVKGRFAAVRLQGMRVRVTDDTGTVVAEPDNCREVKFLKDDLLLVRCGANTVFYMDLRNGRRYAVRPRVLRYGSIELLQVNREYCSRTKRAYTNRCGLHPLSVVWMEYYVKMYDCNVPPCCRRMEYGGFFNEPQVCLLEGDEERVYYLSGVLPDRSIIVMDEEGRYYHVEKGSEKRYIACNHPSGPSEDFDVVTAQLQSRAQERMAERQREEEREAEKKRQRIIDDSRDAVPYQIGAKWGLKTAERVLIPPVYRRILPPVGGYCAYQDGSCQWGVLTVDGRVVIEARYMEVEIDRDGTARLTLVPGKVERVRLSKRW